ncbi:hypothetical protein RUM43_005552 [Polyplax serrata]|uniref:AAA+ ATPase domain-containing protein n=1 Tax=Polyplax serrata TaxID=468196 RepID=A0AAN8P055_POLSC
MSMRVYTLPRNPFNVQRCLLPDCDFLKKNYGKYCLISSPETDCKFLVKIGLYQVKTIKDTIYLDPSVISHSTVCDMCKIDSLNNTAFNNFVILKTPQTAKKVNVVIVFTDVFCIKKYSRCHNDLINIIRNILKFFAFCNKSSLSLVNLNESKNCGISSLVVTTIDNSKKLQLYEVDSMTEIIIEKVTTELKLNQSQLKANLSQIGGCKKAYELLKEAIHLGRIGTQGKFSSKILLIGPSGSGKTTLVRYLAHELNMVLLEISAIEAKSSDIFEKAQIYAENNENCIVLIENIDLLCGKRQSKKSLGELIKFVDSVHNIIGINVICTTSSLDDVDIQLRKHGRFEDEIEITIPTASEREDIINKILVTAKVTCSDTLLNQVAKWTPGFVAADLKLLVTEALLKLYKMQNSVIREDSTLLENCFKLALNKVIPFGLKGAVGLCTGNEVTFSQIGGLDSVKKVLNLSVTLQLENPNAFHKLGVPLTKGILLYGPPGCAKTTLVKALAKESNTTFLATSAADLYSPYVGDAENKIVQLFARARIGAPAIVFIDEIDAVVGSKSGDRERGVQERILSTLLVEMDGVGLKVNTKKDVNPDGDRKTFQSSDGVIVIGATNHPQLLDDALKRPGRFDKLIYIPPPDVSERLKILTTLTSKMPLHDSVNLERLAEVTEFYSGADLKNLCQESGLHALTTTNMTAEEVHQSHFEHVISQFKPSLNEKIISFYESFQKFNQ